MKTSEQQWYDLFHAKATRRDFLRVGGSVAGLVALGGVGCSRGDDALRRTSVDPFPHGIASGDPGPDSVVLWTRLAPEAVEASGGPATDVSLAYEIASSESFSKVVATGSIVAPAVLGHSAHAEVGGLEPDREYFYRWIAGGEASLIGRTRTAPLPDADIDRFRFAFASCQQYEHGFYTAYRHMAEENLDLIVHLGDYIYETSWGSDLVRHHEGPEIVTLDDYRARYTTYRSDPDLQAAHASAPWVVTWDDHEVDNNYAAGIPEDDQPLGSFALRRASAYQAFYEFMPLRRSAMPLGPNMGLYRALRFGKLLDMSVLDTRQYRDDQPCGDRRGECAERHAPGRTLLGDEQRNWLLERMASADATWNVLAQQIVMAEVNSGSDGEDSFSMDAWDGYPHERRELLETMKRTGTPGPVVLTGDTHSNWASELKTDFASISSAPIGTEFAGTSISSGGNGRETTSWGAAALSNNPHIKFHNGQRGYVTATLTPESWTSDYRVVPVITEPDGEVETKARFVVRTGSAGIERG